MKLGRRQFESVVAQAPKVKLKELNLSLSSSATVSAGTNASIDVFASVGTIGKVIEALIFIPGNLTATSGTHKIEVSNYPSDLFGDRPLYIKLQNAYNQGLGLKYNTFTLFDSANSNPKSEEAQMEAIKTIKFDSTKGLRFTYFNDTNVTYADKRTITLFVEEMEAR